MSSNDNIKTLTGVTGNDQAYKSVTGTDIANKRALDGFTVGSNLVSTHALLNIIMGTLPNSNFDEIQRTVNVDGSETFVFSYQDVSLYQVDITTPQGNYNIKINDLVVISGDFLLEDDSGSIQLEDASGNLILEGA